ncbi:MAG: hypothetical protein J7M03_01885 [Candidatus Desulfofervidaceae bacterium]|nr:hypothetical protein [Candidatus Desulfofervidaceae bacterium]
MEGNSILVLDETKLPFAETYIEVKNLEEALKVLREMKTRAFGQVLLFFYTCILTREIDKTARAFKRARPTFDFFRLAEMIKEVSQQIPNIKEMVKTIITVFEQKRKKRAQKLAQILPHEASILTICNLNGELLYLYEALAQIGKTAVFYVSETRPYLQGTRLTFWELDQASIPAKLICDNQAAILMQQRVVNCVIAGSDRSNKKGDIINKIGTYSLARLAYYFHIPFYVLVQYPKEIEIETIQIEERPQEEVFMWLGEVFHPTAIYPAFDITPSAFISGWIDISGKIRCV